MDPRPTLSEELYLDKDLKLTNQNFQKIILDTIKSTKTTIENLSAITWPNDYVFVSLATRSYTEIDTLRKTDVHGKEIDKKLGKWQLLTVAYNNNITNDYVGAAYWNPDTNQIIISHRGTIKSSLGCIFTDIKGIALNQHVCQVDSAVTFTDKVIRILKDIKKDDRDRPHIHLFFTGHSLGGWLAQITTFTAKYVINDGNNFIMNHQFEETGYHASAVVFDSPGAKCVLERLQDSIKKRCDSLYLVNTLDITCYLSAPNVFNACNPHVGTIYRICLNFSEEEINEMKSNPIRYLQLTHNKSKFKEMFDPETGRVRKDKNGELKIFKMKDWPMLISGDKEATYRDKIKWCVVQMAEIAVTDSFVTRIVLKAGQAFYAWYSGKKWYSEFMQELHKFSSVANETNDFHINNDILDKAPYRTIYYDYEDIGSSYKNEHRLTVFTVAELQFLESYKLLNQSQLQLPDSYKIEHLFNPLQQIGGLKEKITEMLSDYEIENGVVKRTGNLYDFILFIKNVIAYFPDIKKEIEEDQKHLSTHILKSFYQDMSSKYMTSIENSLEFRSDILKISEFLQSNVKIMHATHSCTFFGIGVLRNNLLQHLNNTDCKEHTFFSLQRILYLDNSVFIQFLREIQNKCFIVVECNPHPTNREKLFITDILERVQENGNIKIAFVTERASPFQIHISEYARLNKLSYQENDITFKFSDLSTSCQDKLLETTVIFNGKESPLRTVPGIDCRELDEIIDSETIAKLVKNEIIAIGKPLPDETSEESYYIFRKLLRKIRIIKEFYKIDDLENDLFLVSCDSNDSLPITLNENTKDNFLQTFVGGKPVNVKLLKGDNDEFKDYCIRNPNINIHWFKKENDCYIWQRSRASNLSNYHKYIENYHNNISETDLARKDNYFEIIDDINKFKEKIIIIAAEPGMGKSTFLRHLGNSISSYKLCFWVNLVKHKIEENDFNTNDDVISFLLGSNNTNTTSDRITRKLINHCMTRNNCIILLDGFDEILEKDQNTVLNLLKTVQTTNVEKVFITTRLHLRDKLEDIVSTFAYNLIPFSHEDQKQFLKKFWQHDIDPDVEEATLDEYISELLKFLSKSMGDKERSFMGIPLQMRMVAECFRKELHNSLNEMQHFNSKPTFPKDFNVLKLYDSFVDNKYRIYFEKIGGEEIALSDIDIKTFLTSGITEFHGRLALNELFPKIDCEMEKYLVDGQSFSKIPKSQVNLVGIFQFINERIIFTHRTFAEYFAADILARRLNSSRKYAIELLSKELFSSKNKVIKTFLDYHLANKPILAASLKGYSNLDINYTNINVVDILGRNALHYAAQEGHKEIIDELLKKDIDVNVQDDLGKTALHYAARYNGDQEIIQRILAKAEANVDFINIKDKNQCSSLYYAAQQGKWELVEYLILKGASVESLILNGDDANVFDQIYQIFYYTYQNKIDLVTALLEAGVDIASRDKHGNTLLHVAARKGYFNIITLLLEKGAKINVLNNRGLKPINYAAEIKKWDIVELLIEDCNLNDLNNEERDLFLKDAISNNNWKVVKIFMKDKTRNLCINCLNDDQKVELLSYTILDKDSGVAKFLIETVADINLFKCQQSRLIHLAAENALWSVVQLLLRKNGDLNDLNEPQKESLLVYSVKYANWDIVNFFLVNSNAWKNDYFQHLYDSLNHEEIAKCLCYFITLGRLDLTRSLMEEILNGNEDGDINFLDNHGRALLKTAVQNRNLEIVQYLVHKGSSLKYDQKDIISAADDLNVAKFLIERIAILNNIPILHAAVKYSTVIILEYFIMFCNFDIDACSSKGNSALHLAVIENKLDAVKCLVKSGANIFLRNYSYKTPIDIAWDEGCRSIEKFLLRVKSHYKELFQAIRNGKLNKVRSLVECHINVNVRFNNKFTLLNMAAGYGNFHIVKYFIEKGADPSLTDVYGNTVLHWTAFNAKTDVFNLLVNPKYIFALSHKTYNYIAIERKCDSINTETFPQLEYFYINSEYCNKIVFPDSDLVPSDNGTDLEEDWLNDRIEMVKYIVGVKKVDVNLKNSSGFSVLHLMSRIGFVSALKYLINDVENTDVNLKDETGKTALHFSLNDEVCAFLVNKLSRIDVKDINGNSALHSAALYGNLNAVKYFLKIGLSFNMQNNNDETPLHLAVHFNHVGVIEFFLKQGADLYIKNSNGNTPKDIALETNVIKLIKHEEETRLLRAVDCGDINSVRTLIQHDVNINTNVLNEGTPLFCAVNKNGNMTLIKYLLDEGANIFVKQDNLTLLHIAVKRMKEIIELLLNRLERMLQYTTHFINLKDSEGNTALMWAAGNDNLSAVILLLRHGASVHVRNNDGMTALHVVSQYDCSEIAERLYDAGADVFEMDKHGRKPIHVAAQYGHMNVVKCFVSRNVSILEKDKDGWIPLHYSICNNKLEEFSSVFDIYDMLHLTSLDRQSPFKFIFATHIFRVNNYDHVSRVNSVLQPQCFVDSILHPNDLDGIDIKTSYVFEHLDDIQYFKNRMDVVAKIVKYFVDYAHALDGEGKYKESLALFRLIYSWQEKQSHFGPNHRNTLKTRTNIAMLLSKLCQYEHALANLTQICGIQEAVPDYLLDALRTKHNIAEVLYKQGKYDDALNNYKDVLKKRIELLRTEDHLDVLITKFHIGRVRNNQGYCDEALQTFKEVFKLQKEKLTDIHPDTLKTLFNIGFAFYRQKKFSESSTVITEVIKKRKKVLGHSHPDTLTAEFVSALLLNEDGKHEEALQILNVIYSHQCKALGVNHPDTLATRQEGALTAYKQGKVDVALNILRDVLDRKKKVLGENHPYTAQTIEYIEMISLGNKTEGLCVIQ